MMAKVTMMIASTNERINLPSTKDGLVSHSSSGIGFNTLPGLDDDAAIVLGLVAVVCNVETIVIVGVADAAETELENIVRWIIGEIKEEDLLAAAFLLQTKTALSATGTGIYIHSCDIQIGVGLGDDVELSIVDVVDPADMKFL